MSSLELKFGISSAHDQNVERRLFGIEETLKWLVRLVLGALILAVVGLVLQGGISGVA